MTYEEAVEQIFARASELGVPHANLSHGLLYRRIGRRQQQLYRMAAAINEEWAGAALQATLDANGEVDLALSSSSSVLQIGTITRIEILDPGSSAYAAGDEVHQVTIKEPDVADDPRCYLRDRALLNVGGSLDGVATLKVWYSYVPDLPLSTEDGSTELELHEPHDELLVVDGTQYLLERSPQPDDGDVSRALQLLQAEEEELAADFQAYVTAYAGAVETRR